MAFWWRRECRGWILASNFLGRLLFFWLAQYETPFRFTVMLPDVQTQIIQRHRYRLPDIMLCPEPLPKGSLVNVVPWAVIEISSPTTPRIRLCNKFNQTIESGVDGFGRKPSPVRWPSYAASGNSGA